MNQPFIGSGDEASLSTENMEMGSFTGYSEGKLQKPWIRVRSPGYGCLSP
jgi:hypothetical protein